MYIKYYNGIHKTNIWNTNVSGYDMKLFAKIFGKYIF